MTIKTLLTQNSSKIIPIFGLRTTKRSYNLRLCQRFYGVLNLFEVILRNAVNEHYMAYYSDSDWIVNQADG